MTKAELIETMKEFPDEAEVMTSLGDASRWDIFKVFYDKERNTIVIV